MATYDRTEQIKYLNLQRKVTTQKKVDLAIQKLIRLQEAINFNSVANESGLAKSTLYNNPSIKERIESLREQQRQVPTPAQVKREMNDTNKDAIIASLKRKVKKLEEEVKILKEQTKRNYTDIYDKL